MTKLPDIYGNQWHILGDCIPPGHVYYVILWSKYFIRISGIFVFNACMMELNTEMGEYGILVGVEVILGMRDSGIKWMENLANWM